jgi:hypothetical protein
VGKAAGQVSWPAGLTSGPHASNLRPEHRLTPINTPVLPLVEHVKKVKFSYLYCSHVHSSYSRERGEVLRAKGLLSFSRVLRVS